MGASCCGLTRRNYLMGSAGAMIAATGIASAGLGSATEAQPAPAPNPQKYRCPPCGCASDKVIFDKPGSCPSCGMTLIPIDQHDVTKVAVLMFDGVEIIDFAGPWEVFGTAGFLMHTVAPTLQPVTTVFGQKLTPDFTFATSPRSDVLLIPGGGVSRYFKTGMIDWIRAQAATVDHVMSVCTGAYLLQNAGLLDGLTVTATAGAIEDFRSPTTHVVYDRRYVDNGKIITTAGLSAGIDGALHLVSRIRGPGVAQSVALAMEYHWEPDGKWARADLADRFLPDELIPRRGSADGPKMALLSTDGDTNKWQMQLLFTDPSRSAEVIALLRQWIGANRAVGGRVTQLAHIPGPPVFAASASDSELRWSFVDDGGGSWRGVATVAPGKNGTSGLVATVQIARANLVGL